MGVADLEVQVRIQFNSLFSMESSLRIWSPYLLVYLPPGFFYLPATTSEAGTALDDVLDVERVLVAPLSVEFDQSGRASPSWARLVRYLCVLHGRIRTYRHWVVLCHRRKLSDRWSDVGVQLLLGLAI